MALGIATVLASVTLAAVASGCRQNVYIGEPLDGDGLGVLEGGSPIIDAAPPVPDGPRPEDADAEPPFPWYLHAVGSKLYDSNDGLVSLKGVSWAGMETARRVPDGLHARLLESLFLQVETLGFNAIRIPYSSESITPSSFPTVTGGIDPLRANPDLAGLSSLEVLDRIVDAAARHHLRVILNRYRFLAADLAVPPAKWYSGSTRDDPTGGYPEQRWIDDWVTLVGRYSSRPNVVGCDLHEEPASPSRWGDGNPDTDWKMAAERAGNAVLAANPNLLVIVQGVDVAEGLSYWAGGNLKSVGTLPVNLVDTRQLVYAIHDYGKSINTTQPWFSDTSYPANLAPLWDDRWGYLVKNDLAPVLVGAFSDRKGEPAIPPDIVVADQAWRQELTTYIDANDLGFVFWALNPSAEGKAGLLKINWLDVDPEWTSLLKLGQTGAEGD